MTQPDYAAIEAACHLLVNEVASHLSCLDKARRYERGGNSARAAVLANPYILAVAKTARERDALRAAAAELCRRLTSDLARTDLDCLKGATKDAWRKMIATLERKP